MLPIRHRSIFKSRWIALLWAGGIIWSAVEFAGGQPGADAGNNAAVADGSTQPGAGQPDNGDAEAEAAVSSAINTLQGMR